MSYTYINLINITYNGLNVALPKIYVHPEHVKLISFRKKGLGTPTWGLWDELISDKSEP